MLGVKSMEDVLLTRRALLKGLATFSALGIGVGGYAVAEPFRLNIVRYRFTPSTWSNGLKLRIAVIADLHVCEPWMGLRRVEQIVARTNALSPDLVLLLGDFVPSHRISKLSYAVPHHQWAAALGKLRAPLGRYAVLGNHDWWEDINVQRRRSGPVKAGEALQHAGIDVLENRALSLAKNGQQFWLAGLGDQWAFWPRNRDERRRKIPYTGVDDLEATLGHVTTDAPLILMAHEPDIFASLPKEVSLTVSGHTHGGQVQVFGYRPIVPSRFGSRYAYGLIEEDQRHLVVSAGLGVSGLPVRLGVPPEIVLLELGESTS